MNEGLTLLIAIEEIYVEKLPYTMDEEWNIIIIWTYT
jgi:hypothetical protein